MESATGPVENASPRSVKPSSVDYIAPVTVGTFIVRLKHRTAKAVPASSSGPGSYWQTPFHFEN